MHLNRGKNENKKKLYKMIKNLPYSETEQDYTNNYNSIISNRLLEKDLKNYLENRNQHRLDWVKCYMKGYFTGGMVTTSRIEAKHRIYKQYINDDSRLCELFDIFKTLEEEEIQNYKDEIRKFKKKENSELEESVLIKECRKFYSNYIIEKVKDKLLKTIHYDVKKGRNKW